MALAYEAIVHGLRPAMTSTCPSSECRESAGCNTLLPTLVLTQALIAIAIFRRRRSTVKSGAKSTRYAVIVSGCRYARLHSIGVISYCISDAMHGDVVSWRGNKLAFQFLPVIDGASSGGVCAHVLGLIITARRSST